MDVLITKSKEYFLQEMTVNIALFNYHKFLSVLLHCATLCLFAFNIST